jgi:hypothetical protein
MRTQPDTHEIGVSYIWRLSMTLRAQEHEIARALIFTKSLWNYVAALKLAFLRATPTQCFCFCPIHGQATLALVSSPVVHDFTIRRVHGA